MVKHYKYLIWHGVITKVECTDHSYAWSGAMPCTGAYKCIYCGRESIKYQRGKIGEFRHFILHGTQTARLK